MRRVSRRYKEIKEKILSDRVYPISEGLEFVKNNNTEKSKNIRVSFTLNWRNQKNVLKGKTILPNFTSRKDKMVVIENGLSSDTLETINSKNNVFSSSVEDLLRIITEKRKNTWGFTKVLAKVDSEKDIKVIESILVPKGMFPSRKNGMLCSEREMIEKIHSFELGERDIKTDKGGNIHGLLGTSDLSVKQLEENYFKFKSEVNSIRPSNWKGEFLISSVISTNSGPGVKISTK